MPLNDRANLHLRYFASLREQVACGAEELARGELDTVAALRAHLAARGGCWAAAFAPEHLLLVAVNHVLVPPDAPLTAGDEVAFFPPVTGG